MTQPGSPESALDVTGESVQGQIDTSVAATAQEPAPQPTRVARARLPETASLMPLVAPMGGLLIGTGLLVGFWRRRVA